MARQEASTGNDDSSMSILDVFANGMGCVLMLMVVFVLRITVTSTGSGQESRPTMVTLAWSTENPPIGSGPSKLKVRVLRSDGYVEPSEGDLPKGWNVVSTSGRSYGQKAMDHESVVILAPEMPKNSRWKLQLGLDYSKPPLIASRDKLHPFEKLADRISKRLDKLDNPTERVTARAEIIRLVDDYRKFLEIVTESQNKWIAKETSWQSTGITYEAAVNERWTWANECFEKLKSLSYPPTGNNIDAGWYESFLRTATNKDGVNIFPPGTLQIAEFESALSALIRGEILPAGTSGDSVNLLASDRAKWAIGMRSVVDEGFSLPISVTFVGGIGEPIVDEPCVVDNPFLGTSSDGWTSVSMIEVDRTNSAEWNWEEIEPIPEPENPTGQPLLGTTTQLSQWDLIWANWTSHDPEKDVVGSIDRALALLASKQDSQGAFSKASEADDQTGPGITALALMSFFARGHSPAAVSSQYRTCTIKGINQLLSLSESDGGKLGRDGTGHKQYHHGFATMALAQSVPLVERASELDSANAAEHAKLLERIEKALDSAVSLLLGPTPYGPGGTGGWGYNGNFDDTSVAAVQVKALIEAYYALPARRDDIKASLQKAKTFFESSRVEFGTYEYRASKNSDDVPEPTEPLKLNGSNINWPARLPGCLLAECYCNPAFLSSGERESWNPGLKRFALWTPKANDLKGSYAHYALYYSAHLRFELRYGPSLPKNAEWSKKAVAAILAGQQTDGRFAKGTYGTAMAIIALSLQLKAAVLDEFQK